MDDSIVYIHGKEGKEGPLFVCRITIRPEGHPVEPIDDMLVKIGIQRDKRDWRTD